MTNIDQDYMNSQKKSKSKKKVDCLRCGKSFFVGNNPKPGKRVECSGCDAHFIIIEVDPVLIEWPHQGGYFDDDVDIEFY